MVEQRYRKPSVPGSSPGLSSKMRRLTSHYQKQQFKNNLKLFFLIIFLIGLTIFFGLKMIIFMSSTVANIFFKKDNYNQVNNQKEINLISLFIDPFPEATNSGEIIVSGSTLNADKITLFLNNQEKQTVNVKNNNLFELNINDLKEGENKFYLEAKNSKTNQKKKSDTFTVIFKKTKPKLEILSPANEEKTNLDEVVIKGLTEPDNTVQVNQQPTILNGLGEFQQTIKLKEGENLIEIIAIDKAGNFEKKEIKVFFERD